MTTLTIQVDFELDNQFFEDILVTALEGGSNYWIGYININHPRGAKPRDIPTSMWAAQAINEGKSVDFHLEGDEKETLTKGALVNGVSIWATNHPTNMTIVDDGNGHMTIDTANIDASDADAILQYALFGKVVYG